MKHFMIDCYDCREHHLDSLHGVNDFFNQLCADLHLSAVMPPFLLPYDDAKDVLDVGISAFVLLEGGHITVHTFPRRACVFVDVLSPDYVDEKVLMHALSGHFICQSPALLSVDRRFVEDCALDERMFDGIGGGDASDFGPHILTRIDGVDIEMEQLYDILDTMPRRISMTPICRPYVLKSSVSKPKFLSGIILIAQSHIAFHYDIDNRALFCDLFSCSFFNIERFSEYLKGEFNAEFKCVTVTRGSKHNYLRENHDKKKKGRNTTWNDNAR